VADDKVVYAYVPDMISYYLGEEALLPNVPIYPCVDPDRRAEVLDRLDELVLKPVDGYGARHRQPARTRAGRSWRSWRRRSGPAPRRGSPRISSTSTHPTFSGEKLERVRGPGSCLCCSPDAGGTDVQVLPAALSRVAPAGSMIVNSRGGGAKDTWVLR
jgi:carboxylate-amine ligase